MRRASFVAFAAVLWLLACGDAPLSADDPLPNRKCVTLSGTKKCHRIGDEYCSRAPGGCTGQACRFCDATTVMPDKVCVVIPEYTGTCTPNGPFSECDRTSNAYTGTCQQVDGGNCCTCSGLTAQGTCGDAGLGNWPCQ
jgi:hypothetical protein